MKKLVSIFLCLTLMCMTFCVSGAEYIHVRKDITVTYNGELVDFKDTAPLNIDGFTMVPVRAVFEMAGCRVSFDEAKRQVTATKGDEQVELTIDKKEAFVTRGKEKEKKELDIAPCIIEGRTLVPVRFISESLGFIVKWNANYKEVVIIDTDSWKNKLQSESVFSNVLFKDIGKKELFAIKTSVNADFSAFKDYMKDSAEQESSKEKYACSLMLDKNNAIYIKGDFLYELSKKILPEDISAQVGGRYLKIAVPNVFARLTGITLSGSGNIWDSLEKALNDDKFIYTSTVRDINILIDLLCSFKVCENEKVIEDKNILSISDGVVCDFESLLAAN